MDFDMVFVAIAEAACILTIMYIIMEPLSGFFGPNKTLVLGIAALVGAVFEMFTLRSLIFSGNY